MHLSTPEGRDVLLRTLESKHRTPQLSACGLDLLYRLRILNVSQFTQASQAPPTRQVESPGVAMA